MIPITASILIILTKTASIHANNGNIINTAIPINIKLKHPDQLPFSSFIFFHCYLGTF